MTIQRMRALFQLFLVIILSITASLTVAFRENTYDASAGKNRASTLKKLTVHSFRSEIQCAVLCTTLTGCAAFNWIQGSRQCEVIAGVSGESDIITRHGAQFFVKEGNGLVDDCPATAPCNDHGICMDLVGDYRCVCESQYGGKDCQTDCSSVDYCPVRYHDDVPVTLSITEHDGESVDVDIPVILESGVFGRDWIVVMRRIDGSGNFTRDFAAYKKGFGDFKGEFWLGNEALHLLTFNGSRWRLRMDMMQQLRSTQEYRYAEYTDFSVSHESEKYKLTVTGYSGNAGDAMADHNNRVFKSIDTPCIPPNSPRLRAIHGDCLGIWCVHQFKFGWWFSKCGDTFPTGDYFNRRTGIMWQKWMIDDPLEYIDMKIKPYP